MKERMWGFSQQEIIVNKLVSFFLQTLFNLFSFVLVFSPLTPSLSLPYCYSNQFLSLPLSLSHTHAHILSQTYSVKHLFFIADNSHPKSLSYLIILPMQEYMSVSVAATCMNVWPNQFVRQECIYMEEIKKKKSVPLGVKEAPKTITIRETFPSFLFLLLLLLRPRILLALKLRCLQSRKKTLVATFKLSPLSPLSSSIPLKLCSDVWLPCQQFAAATSQSDQR